MLFRCNYLALVGGGNQPKYPPNKGNIGFKLIFYITLDWYFLFFVPCSTYLGWPSKTTSNRNWTIQSNQISSFEEGQDCCGSWHNGEGLYYYTSKLGIWLQIKLSQVYTFTLVPQQLHVFETCMNSCGLCTLCPSSTNSLLALPGNYYHKLLMPHLKHCFSGWSCLQGVSLVKCNS